MRTKLRFIDKIHNTETVTEIIVPDKDHLEAQKKFRANIFRSRKGKASYTRKIKHKNQIFNE